MKALSKQIIAVTAIAAGLVFSGSAHARMFEQEHGRPDKGRADQIIQKLQLTAQQEAQIKQLQTVNRKKAKELFRRLREKRAELAEELDKPRSDPSKIKALVAELKQLQGRLIEHRVDDILKMKKILTAEQYEKFNQTLRSMRPRNLERKVRR